MRIKARGNGRAKREKGKTRNRERREGTGKKVEKMRKKWEGKG